MLHNNHTGDIRPESQSALYPLIIVSRGGCFDVIHSSGALQAAGLSSYDEAVSFALRIQVLNVDQVRIRDVRNRHVPKWTYPLIVDSDYARFADWRERCRHLLGHEEFQICSI
jgi:hypothetical protein